MREGGGFPPIAESHRWWGHEQNSLSRLEVECTVAVWFIESEKIKEECLLTEFAFGHVAIVQFKVGGSSTSQQDYTVRGSLQGILGLRQSAGADLISKE